MYRSKYKKEGGIIRIIRADKEVTQNLLNIQ